MTDPVRGENPVWTANYKKKDRCLTAHTVINVEGIFKNPQSNKAFFTLYRDISGGTLTNLGNSGDGLMGAIYGSETRDSLTMHTYDTPSTTSAIEYKVYYRSANGSTVTYNPDGTNWTLTAMEVLA